MGTFHRTIADNVRAFRDWHYRKHAGEWETCCWEPCQDTEPEFRRVWS